MKIDCIADLHGHYPQLGGGDLLIIAGDITARDLFEDWDEFCHWFDAQEYRKKIWIGGNHDNFLTHCANNVECVDIVYGEECEKQEYLKDSGVEFEGLKIWGSPWVKSFPGMNPNCKAFAVDTEEELAEKWALIPPDTDILITHSPAHGVLDKSTQGTCCGSRKLTHTLTYTARPKLHVFGHIHEAYGRIQHFKGCVSINASHVNEHYKPVNKPVRIEL